MPGASTGRPRLCNSALVTTRTVSPRAVDFQLHIGRGCFGKGLGLPENPLPDAGDPVVHDPFNAPAWGVLCIVEPDKDCVRHIVQGGAYYVYRADEPRWYEADMIGMLDYLARPGPRKVIFGYYVNNQLWNEVFQQAYNDVDFLGGMNV